MDPSSLIPTPDRIPVAWGWLEALLLITFFLHILAMNLMVGTLVIGFWNHFKGNGELGNLSRNLAGKLPIFIVFTINLGVAPLLFVQVLYGQFIYTSSILMAVFQLAIVLVLIIAYYGAYIYAFKYDILNKHKGLHFINFIPLLCFLVIAFFFVNNITMMQRPETWTRYFSQPDGFLLNLSDPTLIPRYLHFMISSLAVAGLAIAFYFNLRAGKEKESYREYIRLGLNWYILATFLNFGIGFLFLETIPDNFLNISSTVHLLFIIFLVAGITTGIFSLIYAISSKVRATATAAFITLIFMVADRELLRMAYLKPFFHPSELRVDPQYSPMIIFFLFFIGGLIILFYLVKMTGRLKEVRK